MTAKRARIDGDAGRETPRLPCVHVSYGLEHRLLVAPTLCYSEALEVIMRELDIEDEPPAGLCLLSEGDSPFTIVTESAYDYMRQNPARNSDTLNVTLGILQSGVPYRFVLPRAATITHCSAVSIALRTEPVLAFSDDEDDQFLPADDRHYQIFVKTLTGKTVVVNARGTDTVQRLKKKIEVKEGIPEDQLRMIFEGKQLESHHTLAHYRVRKGSTVMLLLKLCGGKPVILLYSPIEQRVDVKLSLVPEWHFSAIYPVKPAVEQKDGSSIVDWQVIAHQDGTLTDVETERKVTNLYWEALAEAKHSGGSELLFDPRQPILTPANGVAVPKGEIVGYLEETLDSFSLTVSARCDFITYWLPQLNEIQHSHVALRFLSLAEIESAAPLAIEPKPDFLMRVFLLFKGVNADLDERWQGSDSKDWREVVGVDKQDASIFRAVEWGGMHCVI